MKKQQNKTKVLGVRLDEETYKRVKYYASKSGRTPSSIARRAIEKTNLEKI